MEGVRIGITGGYGATAASVPRRLVQAMKLDIGSMYEHREDVIVGTIAAELPMSVRAADGYKLFRVPAMLV